MAQEKSSDYEEARPKVQVGFTAMNIMIIDIVVYGLLIPLVGTYLGGGIATMCGVGPKMEVVLTIVTTFALLYMSFCLLGEASYWKHLFAFDDFFATLLQFRDAVNTLTFFICLYGLASTVEEMVQDRAMKMTHLNEGTGYVFFKALFEFLHVDPSVLRHLGLKLPHSATLMDPNFGENQRFENAATYMLFWSMISACVAKLIYFNTLFTYLRAMNIFISLKPVFEDDEDDIEPQ